MQKINRVTERLLHISNRPPQTSTTVPVSAETIAELKHFADLMYSFGVEVAALYYNGRTDTIKYFVEYGLPSIYIDLLQASKNIPAHKTLFRFDFFFSDRGPKLVEISSNPWGLLAHEDHAKHQSSNGEGFPAIEIYHSLCENLAGNHIGIWRNFGFIDDVAALISKLRKFGITVERIDASASLGCYDAVFYDIETAYFDGTLPHLLPHASKLLPSPTNEIIKRKTLLVLAYLFSKGEIVIPSSLSREDKEYMGKFLEPAYLIPDQLVDTPVCGVIKDIVGIWGLQVTILPPRLVHARGENARRKRKKFRQHLTNAIKNRNAILQDYIAPLAIRNCPELFTEFSLVYKDEEAFPYVRIYKGTPEHKIGIGDGLVRIENHESSRGGDGLGSVPAEIKS